MARTSERDRVFSTDMACGALPRRMPGRLDALTRAMALEFGEHGIRVNVVNPTVTLTAMADEAWSDPEKAGPLLKRIPLGRFAQPQEAARAILFLLSEGASIINGVTLRVDGGHLIA